jgi:hypothetical protein
MTVLTACIILSLPALILYAGEQFSELHCGTTGCGKSTAAARSIATERGSSLNGDPHENSMARRALEAATGNVLFDCLSDPVRWIPFNLMSFLTAQNNCPDERFLELFTAILLLHTGAESVASSPLKEEWLVGALLLLVHQRAPKSPLLLPFAFLPNTPQFEDLVRDCVLPEIKSKFEALTDMTPRALRAEVGSAARLVSAVFRSEAFRRRLQGGLDLAAFYQNKGKLIVEAGNRVSEAARGVIINTLVVLTIEIAKQRPKPEPVIKIRLDEANNCKLVTPHVLKGIAELRKYGVFFELYVQNLNFPCDPEVVLQNCRIHHWYAQGSRELARKAATDVSAGLRPEGEETRADLVERLTNDLLFFQPGWRWSRYPWGSKKEYVPLFRLPYPDWPGYKEAKLQEKLCAIVSRPEYRTTDPPSGGGPETPGSTPSSPSSPPPSPRSPRSSLAERLNNERRTQTGGSSATASDEGSG